MDMSNPPRPSLERRREINWHLPAPYTWRMLVLLIAVAGLLLVSARRVDIDKFLALSAEAIAAQLGLRESSQVGRGLARIGKDLFPITLSYRTDVSRVADFDEAKLPWLAYVETVDHREYRMNPDTTKLEETVSAKKVLVEPLGYLTLTVGKMIETIEIAIWATILAVLLSIPLAYLGAANYTPNRAIYAIARGTVSLLRAIPELISALFLVLAFGFGPVAGFLALGLHGAGFLGKFYAEDIEAADKKPQDALRALGASKIRVLRLSVLPQVLPSYIAYTLYILDRNVRMATVIGLVGAGGIGQELKGRYDLFEYGNVGTILVVIFVTVFVLDQISARLRARLIA